MALMDFIKKQFIDIIQWTEDGQGTLAWRYPMRDMEIQNGAQLVVRESQMALFVNEGVVADMFGPGSYTLGTRTLPLLTNLKHWDKLFASPFKSDVYFFSTRQQIDQKWGTPQAITIRDAEFGAVRLRAFGNYSFRVNEPRIFHTEISGTQSSITSADVDGQLRGLVVQNISVAMANSRIPFLDLASNLVNFAQVLAAQLAAEFGKLGLKLEGVTVQSVSLPEELQKIMDQKIGMGMVGGDLTKFMQYQAAQALTGVADGGGTGLAGEAMGLGAGVALGQVMAQQLTAGLQAAPATVVKPEDVMATLEKLGELASKGILTAAEFEAKKAELLKKLV
jgi:membrane protease subunit (stomatin/prohibitin family)